MERRKVWVSLIYYIRYLEHEKGNSKNKIINKINMTDERNIKICLNVDILFKFKTTLVSLISQYPDHA